MAGNPGVAPPTLTNINPLPAWPANASDNPWYVIQATGDRDGNGVKAYFVGTSITGEIFRQNESE